MKTKLFISSLFVFLFTQQLSAQNLAWKLLDRTNGLNNDTVQAIYAEHDSALWIGTPDGLRFYDGNRVTIYFNGGLSLAQQSVNEIEASGNKIWLRTNFGISSFDGSNFVNYDTSNGLLSNDIKDIAVDSNGNVWIGSQQGTSMFDGSNFTHYPSIGASVIGIDSGNRVYAVDPPFMLHAISTLKIFNGVNWDTIAPLTNLPQLGIQRIFKSNDGRLLAKSANQLIEFNYPFNPIVTTFKMPGNQISSCVAVDENKIWAGTNGFTSSLLYTEDSIMNFYHAGITRANVIELTDKKLYVGTKLGLAHVNINARPLVLRNEFDLNDIGISIRADREIFSSHEKIGFEVPKGSGLRGINFSDFITVAKKGVWLSNPGIASLGDSPGPLNSNRLGFEWPYVVKVSQAEIDAHKTSYKQVGYQIPEGIKNWPANGDSTLNMSLDLAPYRDVNNNGCYDPHNGDYPIIKGDEALYWIKHSADPNLKLEYHYMLYGFYRPIDLDINQVVFLDFRIINRESSRIDSLKTGYFIDLDLGIPSDDYVGCDSINNSFYVYDSDTVLGSNPLQNPYGNNPPFIGVKFLSDSMTNFISFNIGGGQTGDPSIPLHWYYYLNSRWLNGKHLKYGGYGFLNSTTINTSYMFSGNPHMQTGWTEANPGNGQNPIAPGDRRGIASIPYYSLNAGESKTISVVLGFGRKDSIQSYLENFPEMQRILNHAKSVWDTISTISPDYGSNNNCTLVGLAENNSLKERAELSVYPNPSNGITRLKSKQALLELQVFNMSGKLVLQQRLKNKENSFNLSAFPDGMYLLRVLTEAQKWESHKLILER